MRHKTGRITQRMPWGKVFKARQSKKNSDKWHIEIYVEGEQKATMAMSITSFNANAMAHLLKRVNYPKDPKERRSLYG